MNLREAEESLTGVRTRIYGCMWVSKRVPVARATISRLLYVTAQVYKEQ